mmetsp:Transcript_14979/g.28370  ORF Transcript_14979/g.28370 Transcript_14979/m.28370 type:complete len:263 (+) Transcript_14979:1118-1906(+)
MLAATLENPESAAKILIANTSTNNVYHQHTTLLQKPQRLRHQVLYQLQPLKLVATLVNLRSAGKIPIVNLSTNSVYHWLTTLLWKLQQQQQPQQPQQPLHPMLYPLQTLMLVVELEYPKSAAKIPNANMSTNNVYHWRTTLLQKLLLRLLVPRRLPPLQGQLVNPQRNQHLSRHRNPRSSQHLSLPLWPPRRLRLHVFLRTIPTFLLITFRPNRALPAWVLLLSSGESEQVNSPRTFCSPLNSPTVALATWTGKIPMTEEMK